MDNNFLSTQTPSAMFIEMARDSIIIDSDRSKKRLKELEEAVGTQSIDYQLGYLVGLKTSEICLELSFNEEKKEEK